MMKEPSTRGAISIDCPHCYKRVLIRKMAGPHYLIYKDGKWVRADSSFAKEKSSTRVFIIQTMYERNPQDPDVFSKEEDADKKYMELVKDFAENQQGGDIDFTSVDKALDYMHNCDDLDDYDIRYYVCVIDESLMSTGEYAKSSGILQSIASDLTKEEFDALEEAINSFFDNQPTYLNENPDLRKNLASGWDKIMNIKSG